MTNAFAVRENGRFQGSSPSSWWARTALAARPDGGGRTIALMNHSIGGPVFAGPQVTPWICNPNASTPPLGDPIDAQCNAPTKVELLYRTLAGQFAPYDPASLRRRRPSSDDDGRRQTVPFIVQRVTGTPIAASTRSPCSSTRRSRSCRGRPHSRGATSSSTPSEAGAAPTTRSGARERPPGDAARARLRRREHEPQHVPAELQRRRLRRGGDDGEGDRHRAIRRDPVHDRHRRLGRHDAAAPASRELPGPPGRPDDEPRLPRPFRAGDGLARLPRADSTTSGRRARSQPGHAAAPPNPLFPTAASRLPVWGSNPRIRTTSAARRSSRSAPTGPSSCPARASAAACRPR